MPLRTLHDGIGPLDERVGERSELLIPIDQRPPTLERPIKDEWLIGPYDEAWSCNFEIDHRALPRRVD